VIRVLDDPGNYGEQAASAHDHCSVSRA